MRRLVARYWYVATVVGAVSAGLACPSVGCWMREWHVLRAAFFLSFLLTGLSLETQSVLKAIRDVKAAVASLVSCFVIFPVVAFLLARIWFADDPELLVGMCILGVAPATIASGTIITGIARGNVSLSLLISVVTNLLAIFTIPASLKLLLVFDQELHLPVFSMVRNLCLLVAVGCCRLLSVNSCGRSSKLGLLPVDRCFRFSLNAWCCFLSSTGCPHPRTR